MIKGRIKKKLDELFTNVLKTADGRISGLLIYDRNGNLLMEKWTEDKRPPDFDKVGEGVKVLLGKLHSEFPHGPIGTITSDFDDYRLICTDVGEDWILTSVSPPVDLDTLFPMIYITAEKIVRIMDNKSVWLYIPDFFDVEKKLTPEEGETAAIHEIGIKGGTYKMKVILAGDSGVGKTTLVTQFVEGMFDPSFKSTIGVNIMMKTVEFPKWNIKVIMTIYDAAGQEIFKDVRKTYFMNAGAGFLVFDVTRPETFRNIEKWYVEAKNASPDVVLVLVGNKIDLPRRISKEAGEQLAHKLKLRYIETSALDKDLVDEAFKIMAFLYIFRKRKLTLRKGR